MTEGVIQDLIDHFKDKPLLSMEEVAGVLGVPKKMVYNWTRRTEEDRRLPKVTLGRVVRLPRAEFVAWLMQEYQRRN